tara:strand:+ start:226 stop:1446 length:1221 start_codon:yes stop_codon:yes gene_type:complete
MSDLIGFVSIALVCLFTSYLVLVRGPEIFKIFLTGLVIRVIVLLLGHYIVALPDTSADADSFEVDAWNIAQNGFINLLDHYPGIQNSFYSWMISIPYSLFGRSVLMAQSISLLFGLGCIFFGWKIANTLWDKYIAKKVAWTIALFPSLILYSVITMKEVFVCFFLLLAINYAILWTRTNNIKYVLLSLLGFLGATFFHGAMIAGAIIFLIIVGLYNLKKLFILLKNFRISFNTILPILLIILGSVFIFTNQVKIPKLGEINRLLDPNFFNVKTIVSTKGEASFPQWTTAKSFGELLYKVPIRSVYFTFSPFPWDVKKNVHIIGFLDSLLYFYLVFLIYRNREVIWKDPALRIILIILLFYLIIFGIGVGNFGTGIRHRSKFVVLFILLAAPLLKKFVLKKNRIYRS